MTLAISVARSRGLWNAKPAVIAASTPGSAIPNLSPRMFVSDGHSLTRARNTLETIANRFCSPLLVHLSFFIIR